MFVLPGNAESACFRLIRGDGHFEAEGVGHAIPGRGARMGFVFLPYFTEIQDIACTYL